MFNYSFSNNTGGFNDFFKEGTMAQLIKYERVDQLLAKVIFKLKNEIRQRQYKIAQLASEQANDKRTIGEYYALRREMLQSDSIKKKLKKASGAINCVLCKSAPEMVINTFKNEVYVVCSKKDKGCNCKSAIFEIIGKTKRERDLYVKEISNNAIKNWNHINKQEFQDAN